MTISKKAFSIGFDNIGWLDGLVDDPSDYCAHAHAVARIGGETLEYEATVSATALYLLKSLSEDHRAYREEQFLPCCGSASSRRTTAPATLPSWVAPTE